MRSKPKSNTVFHSCDDLIKSVAKLAMQKEMRCNDAQVEEHVDNRIRLPRDAP